MSCCPFVNFMLGDKWRIEAAKCLPNSTLRAESPSIFLDQSGRGRRLFPTDLGRGRRLFPTDLGRSKETLLAGYQTRHV